MGSFPFVAPVLVQSFPPAFGAAGIAITSSTAETVIGQVQLPANLPLLSTWRLTAWGQFTVGITGAPYTVKARIGGLTGPFLGTITTSTWTASQSGGSFVLDAFCQLITQGGPGVGQWSGFVRHSSLIGSQTNTASNSVQKNQDSTVAGLLVITMALGDAAMTANAWSAGERIV